MVCFMSHCIINALIMMGVVSRYNISIFVSLVLKTKLAVQNSFFTLSTHSIDTEKRQLIYYYLKVFSFQIAYIVCNIIP